MEHVDPKIRQLVHIMKGSGSGEKADKPVSLQGPGSEVGPLDRAEPMTQNGPDNMEEFYKLLETPTIFRVLMDEDPVNTETRETRPDEIRSDLDLIDSHNISANIYHPLKSREGLGNSTDCPSVQLILESLINSCGPRRGNRNKLPRIGDESGERIVCPSAQRNFAYVSKSCDAIREPGQSRIARVTVLDVIELEGRGETDKRLAVE